ncbi:hypothetical protein M0R45_002917 [Rubus argutus]|uniref:WW domain-containing protein n=3 Tax=Rubus argutus TaxID=59490 RepID=A0AAW1YFV3_RUBAR
MGGVPCVVENYINSMAELQATMDNVQKTILAEVSRLVEYQSSCLLESLRAYRGPWYAPEDPALPKPWLGLIDASGSIYYWNTETNITQYEKPKPIFFLTTDYHYHLLTHPTIPHPSYHIPPFATSAYPSESDYGYLSSSPYPSDQPSPCDPYSTSPHNSSYSPITYPHTELNALNVPPYQIPYATDIIPPSALACTAGGTSCIAKDNVPLPKMKKSLCHNLKMRSHVMMKRKPKSQFPRRRRTQKSGGLEVALCKASSLVAVNWDLIVPSDKSLDMISELTVLDLMVKNGSISASRKDAPMFFPGDKKKPFLSAEAVYGQMLGPDELCQIGRAKDLLMLADFQRIVDNSGGPLIDGALARFYFNLSLEKPTTDTGNIPVEDEQSAIVNHFRTSVVSVNHFSQATYLDFGLKPIWLSMKFVESPVSLEVSISESYEHGRKHEVAEFDKFMVCSFTVIELIRTLRVAHLAHLQATLCDEKVTVKNVLSSSKGGFDYDMHLENLIESLTSNSQKLFVYMHDKRIESKCSVLYHWLPSLNWDKKCISDAFLSLEIFVSSVTSKSLLSESCRGGGMSMGNAMKETLIEKTALQIVIATNCANSKQLSYPMHLVEALATETVGRTISTDIDLPIFKAIIVHALQLGLSLWVVVLPFIAVRKKLLVTGINSNGLITVSIEDFSSKKFLCCLLTTAESRTFSGQFRSLEKSKLDGRLNLRVQCISRMELWHMDISCVIDTSGKQLENSHLYEQLKKHYGVFCFVILAEGYLMKFLLYFEDHMFQNWSNRSSKIGACTIIELPQCMNKMQIFPLDNTSWKLVVIKHVQAVLQVNIFYDYVQWVVPLVIIDFGSRFFPFLCECIDDSSTDIENPTVIIRVATDDNLLYWKMTIGSLGQLNLHSQLEFKDEEAARNALEGLTGLLRHDTQIYVGYLLDIPEITVACKNSKFRLVVYIQVSTSILDEDLENVRNTLVSANSTTALRHATSWDAMLILHGPCYKMSLLSLFEIAPQQFYEATLAKKVILDKLLCSMWNLHLFAWQKWNSGVSSGLLSTLGQMQVVELISGTGFSDKVGVTIILDMALVACPVRATTINTRFHNLANFAHSPTLELRLHGCSDNFGGLHADNNLAMLPECLTFYIGAFCFNATVIMRVGQLTLKAPTHTLCDLALLFGEGPAQYLIQSFVLDTTAHMLLVVNPGEVVVKKGILTLSSCKLLICALVMKEKIVVADAKSNEMRVNSVKVIVDALITINMLTTGSCGYWDAKVAFGFHDGMSSEVVKSPENLINADPSNVAVHTEAPWLQLEKIWSNFPLSAIVRHEDMPFFKGGGMIGSLGYGVALLN